MDDNNNCYCPLGNYIDTSSLPHLCKACTNYPLSCTPIGDEEPSNLAYDTFNPVGVGEKVVSGGAPFEKKTVVDGAIEYSFNGFATFEKNSLHVYQLHDNRENDRIRLVSSIAYSNQETTSNEIGKLIYKISPEPTLYAVGLRVRRIKNILPDDIIAENFNLQTQFGSKVIDIVYNMRGTEYVIFASSDQSVTTTKKFIISSVNDATIPVAANIVTTSEHIASIASQDDFVVYTFGVLGSTRGTYIVGAAEVLYNKAYSTIESNVEFLDTITRFVVTSDSIAISYERADSETAIASVDLFNDVGPVIDILKNIPSSGYLIFYCIPTSKILVRNFDDEPVVSRLITTGIGKIH